MSLESEIDKMLASLYFGGYFSPIRDWHFAGGPREHYLSHEMTNRLIEKASLVDCLTSPSEYIREYRKWYEYRKHNK